MAKAIQFDAFGGPEVFFWRDVEVGNPAPNEVRICHTAIGLNFIDTYHRTGLYPIPLPATPGLEAVGTVEAIGSDVTNFSVGDRVGYPAGPMGAYSQKRLFPANKLVRIPDTVSDEDACALLLKGCTVEMLVERIYPVQAGDKVLLHAAAGGVGLLACQWLNALGATVIGTVGSKEKAELASANGCHHTILYREENFMDRVMEITNNKGVPVVYDSVGKATFEGSINCLQRRGMMVTFGNSTGPVDPVSPALLSQKGSLFLTRPTLMDYVATRSELEHSTNRVFDMISTGKIKAQINQRFSLEGAAKAHSALESRTTQGQTLLIP